MTNLPEPGDYFLDIEAHFALRRNTPFILSAKDWALMQKWRADGIPLPVVIEAIDQVFEKNETSGRRKKISSLSYCRHAIKELWAERRELYVGDGSTTPEENALAMLDALATDIQGSSAPAQLTTLVAAQVRDLVREKSVPRIEERLMEIEGEMMQQILATAPVGVADEIRVEIDRTTGDRSQLDEKTRQRTIEANLRRIVRQRFTLPRLTLFR